MRSAKIDLHCHTKYSFDSIADPNEVCDNAIKKGIQYIAITDHCDYDCILSGLYEDYLADEAKKEICGLKEKYSGTLEVLYGIELGGAHIVPKEAQALVTAHEFDFVLGSLHNLRDVPDFSFINFEHMPDGLIRSLMHRNISELCEIAKLPFINAIAHITYPNRYMKAAGREVNLSEFEDEFIKLFQIIIDTGKALEVNTSPYRKGIKDTMPEAELLRLYKSCGGTKITVGSDAHLPEGIGDGTSEALEILENTGFNTITVYRAGKGFDIPISQLK